MTTPMQKLSGQDALFLHMDRPHAATHVTMIYVYDQSGLARPLRFRQIIGHLEKRLQGSPFYRRRIVQAPLGLAYPYWADDPDFDIDFHVRHVALPEPGDWRQFQIMAARIHARQLDLTRPPWEMYVIEGLDNVDWLPKGSFALVTKAAPRGGRWHRAGRAHLGAARCGRGQGQAHAGAREAEARRPPGSGPDVSRYGDPDRGRQRRGTAQARGTGFASAAESLGRGNEDAVTCAVLPGRWRAAHALQSADIESARVRERSVRFRHDQAHSCRGSGRDRQRCGTRDHRRGDAPLSRKQEGAPRAIAGGAGAGEHASGRQRTADVRQHDFVPHLSAGERRRRTACAPGEDPASNVADEGTVERDRRPRSFQHQQACTARHACLRRVGWRPWLALAVKDRWCCTTASSPTYPARMSP